jgi:hypothetical protein
MGSTSFYSSSLSGVDKINFEKAAKMEGLSEEILLLRVKLREIALKEPDNLAAISRAAAILARMLRLQNKLG